MTKLVIKRIISGFMVGIFIGYTIEIIESLFVGDGNFYAYSPLLLNFTKTGLRAVILQYFMTGIIGGCFAGTSIIFEIDNLSLLLQTVIHFAINSIVMFIAGFLCCWFPHIFLSAVIWFAVFIGFYIIFWFVFYLCTKESVKKINEKL